MSRTLPKLVYFDRWMDPVGPKLMASSEGVNLIRLDVTQPDTAWRELETAHGYQLLPSNEISAEFMPDGKLLARCPNILAMSVSGVGYDIVDVPACTGAGVLVINQVGANAESVAQHALGMMLCLSKRMPVIDRALRRPERNWSRWDFTGRELTGRTVGVIGLGNIGRRVAELCRTAFGMKVLAYDPYLDADEIRRRHAEPARFEEVLAKGEFVTVHCPLTPETRGMIDAAAFRLMKPGACFISTARGGIHDEAALYDALLNERLAGAGVDVFEQEPPPSTHPLLALDNVIASPHMAGITRDCLYNMARSAAMQWISIFEGNTPKWLVNPAALPLFQKRHAALFGASGRAA